MLEAAAALLAEGGFDGLTMEAVAGEAGVSKASVYRRYGCRDELFDAVCRAFVPALPDTPDTGSVRGDLTVLLQSMASNLGDERAGRVLPAVLGAAGASVEARNTLSRFTRSRRSPMLEVLGRGIHRGELPTDADPDALADLLAGAITFRTLIPGDRVGPARIDHYLDAVLPRS